MEQFFAEYGKTTEKVFNESSEEEEKGEEEEEEEYVCKMLEVEGGKGQTAKERMIRDLKDILKVVDKERSKVADLIRIGMDEEDTAKKFDVMYLVQSSVDKSNALPGEWLYMKVNVMKQYLSGTEFAIVPGMLHDIFMKTASYWTPQDLRVKLELGEGSGKSAEEGKDRKEDKEEIGDGENKGKEEELSEKEIKIRKAELKIKAMASERRDMKKSKNGFPELGLPITSAVIHGKRMYVCPLEGCTESFQSPRTCDAHLNRHLGYEYGPCGRCGYTNASRDSFDKHKCFAGAKTGGKRPASRGPNVKKRKGEEEENMRKGEDEEN